MPIILMLSDIEEFESLLKSGGNDFLELVDEWSYDGKLAVLLSLAKKQILKENNEKL